MPPIIKSPTQDHLSAGIQWIATMCESDKWTLADEEVEILLGIDAATYQNMKRNVAESKPISMTQDTVERLSLLLGIWKALQLIVPADRKDFAFSWFNKPINGSIFMDRSMKEYMLEKKTIVAMHEVRNYLDSGNW